MMNNDAKRISEEQDVNDEGQPIYRPPEKITKRVKPYWKWVWLVVIALVIVAWIFLFSYFSVHQAPYAAPIAK